MICVPVAARPRRSHRTRTSARTHHSENRHLGPLPAPCRLPPPRSKPPQRFRFWSSSGTSQSSHLLLVLTPIGITEHRYAGGVAEDARSVADAVRPAGGDGEADLRERFEREAL